ncbi:MAG: hypothetical protein A2Z04_00260, partial [Chloroflexi bacterium RBG_16_57_9]
MDPTTLIGPENSLGLPAPFWFIEFFKVLGFALHMVPMNLWYAGLIISAILSVRGSVNSKRFARRLIKQMPFFIAFGINLGIIPLLFTQVAYYQVFYPSTILMAWPWFTVIGLLMVAYYGTYIYALQIRNDHITRLGLAAGWMSTVMFITIGFLFANNFSLMVNLAAWPGLWQSTSVAGAPLGIALNLTDPTLWPRWLMMLGLAVTTVGAYIIVDAAFFARKESDAYKRWIPRAALIIYTIGIVKFAITGTWYFFLALRPDVRALMLSAPYVVLTIITAVAPGLPWLLILSQRKGVTRRLALLTGLAQFGVIALNAVSRQAVQNADLGKYLD